MLGLGTRSIRNWPAKSREAARRLIDQYGEPDVVTDAQLVWHKRGPWRQITAAKILYQHNFPAPHYALFELEPKQDEVIEKSPRGSPQRQAAKPKTQRKTAQRKTAAGNAATGKAALGLARKATRATANPAAA